jgi:hypothetical protein
LTSGVEVTDERGIFDGIVARITDAAGATIIGWMADADPYPDGTPVTMVAAAHELGTPDTPARAPLRTYADGPGKRELGDAAANALGKVIDGADPGDLGEAIGETGVEGVRTVIERGLQPALKSPRGPGHDPRNIPLMDTGHLVDQLSHEQEDD